MNIEKILSFVACVSAGVFCGVLISNFYQNNKMSLCVKYDEFAHESLQDFIQDELPNKYKLIISDTIMTFELLDSPTRIGTNLYSNIKNGVICESEFNASIKNKETANQFLTTIKVRYQLAKPVFSNSDIYIKMSSLDLEEVADALKSKIKSKDK